MCDELVCEYKITKKRKTLTPDMKWFNLILQHYRGRGEHSISEIVQGNAVLNTKWRGSYALLSAVARLTVHLTTLKERMRGPRYDVYGPWPHWDNPVKLKPHEVEAAVESALNDLFEALDDDKVELSRLLSALRPTSITRAEVESALDAMEHANKVMYREGIVHLM